MVISSELLDTTKNRMSELLNQEFEGNIRFEPINVERRIDHDGEDNISIVVVFHGDERLLDPRKLNIVSSQLGDVLERLGFHNVPVESYIAEDEYPEWRRMNDHPTPWLAEEDEDELAAPN